MLDIELPTRRVENWKYSPLDQRLKNVDLGEKNSATGLRADICAKRHPMALLNSQYVNEAQVIEFPANTVLQDPFVLEHYAADDAKRMAHERVILRIGANSQLTVMDQFEGDQGWLNSVVEIELAEGAQLNYFSVLPKSGLQLVHALHVRQQSHSRFEHFVLALGSTFARVDLDVDLLGEGASCANRGAYCLTEQAHFDTHSEIRHLASRTRSDVLFKGIIDDKARGVFNTKAIASKNQKAIEAHQTNRNLLLSSQAEIDTKPELEIYTDDVQCSHGATVGQLDETVVFYLQSRGINEQDARGLLTRSFLLELCDFVQSAGLKEEMTAHLENRLQQHFGK